MSFEPITREEKMLSAIASGKSVDIAPITREEMFLAKAGGADIDVPEPITRKEMFLSEIKGGGPTTITQEIPVPEWETFLDKAFMWGKVGNPTQIRTYLTSVEIVNETLLLRKDDAGTEFAKLTDFFNIAARGGMDLLGKTIKLFIGAGSAYTDGTRWTTYPSWEEFQFATINKRLPNEGEAEQAKNDKYKWKWVEIVTVNGWFDDGNTHIWASLSEGRTSPKFGCIPNGTVVIDWGDGMANSILTGDGSAIKWVSHDYIGANTYIITLTVDGEMGIAGENQQSCLLRYSEGDDDRNKLYLNAIKKVELGTTVTSLGQYAFGGCEGMASIKINNDNISIGEYAFASCSGLAGIEIPHSVNSIAAGAFNGCYNLANVIIYRDVASMGDGAFYGCYSLSSIKIPAGVTSIANNLFYGCSGVRRYDFTAHTAVPALVDANAFFGMPADCEIRVPAALAEEWKAATNWVNFASQIVAV